MLLNKVSVIILLIALRQRLVEGIDEKKLFSSEIEIHAPESLKGVLHHRGALFGSFPTGKTLQAPLYYTRRKLCGDETPNTPDFVKQNDYFLLVDRGGCSFVEKVRNAQRDNAAAVFIADDRCICNENKVCEEDPTAICEHYIPVMDDDGSGDDIKIPSMMLYKSDAEILKSQIINGTRVDVNLSFPVPKAVDGRTEYVLWTSVDDQVSNQFVSTFLEAALELKDRAVFTPKVLIKDGTELGCREYGLQDEVACPGSCTNFGRYCAGKLYGDDDDEYQYHGTKMVVESLRRMCIWEVYGKADGVGVQWWKYMREWNQKCLNSQYSANCAANVFQDVGIDPVLIETCMEDAGHFQENEKNVLLDISILEAEDYEASFAPALYVNDVVIRGSLSFASVLYTLCQTFESRIPDICDKWDACSRECEFGKSCILQDSECIAYEAAPMVGDATFDDDYIYVGDLGDDEYDDEAGDDIADNGGDEVGDDDVDDGVDDDVSEIDVQVTSDPTKAPTAMVSPTESPTKSSMTVPSSEFTFQQKTPHEEENINETVQIFEGGNNSSDFIVGLAAGLGGALIFAIVFVLFVKDRQRQTLLSLEDRRGLLLANNYDDGDTLASPGYSRRSRRSSSRHSWKEARFDNDDDEYIIDFTSDRPRRHQSRRSRHGRSRRYEYSSEEESLDPLSEEDLDFYDEPTTDIVERRRKFIMRKPTKKTYLQDEYGNQERNVVSMQRERSLNISIDDDIDMDLA